MAGPLIGSIGALTVYIAGRHFDSNLMLAIVYAGMFLNLFNLLPISPLDGGRITAIISPHLVDRRAAARRAAAVAAEPGDDPDRHHLAPAGDAGVTLRPEGAGEHRLLRRRAADQASNTAPRISD